MENSFFEDFIIESDELLSEAEDALLEMEGGNNIEENFNKVFRSFHSLKGASGMMGMDSLQKHMHLLEDSFEKFKGKDEKLINQVELYLSGVDHARGLLRGEEAEFDFNFEDANSSSTSSTHNQVAEEDDAFCDSMFDGKVFHVDVLGKSAELNTVLGKLNRYLLIHEIENIDGYLKKKKYQSADAIIVSESLYSQFLKQTKGKAPHLLFGSVDNVSIDSSTLLTFGSNAREREVMLEISNSKIVNNIYQSLNKAIQLLMYQFADLDGYLEQQGRTLARDTLKSEISDLIKLRDGVFE